MPSNVKIVAADMRKLPFPPESFDVVWSEGAAYIMGIEKALANWKQVLKPNGSIAVSELVWLHPDPPIEVHEFFTDEYPAMTDTVTIMNTFRDCGYDLLGHFTLPDVAWWQHYYAPLEAKLPLLSDRYAGDEAALSVIEMTRREIDIRRRFGAWYGYEFFVGTQSRATRHASHGSRAESPST